jgi:hypothetical protein
MPISSDTLEERNARQLKWCKRGLNFLSMLYILGFLPGLLGVVWYEEFHRKHRIETYWELAVILISLVSLFLLIPISLYLMWSRYSLRQLGKALFFAGLPLYVFAVLFLIQLIRWCFA